MRKLLKTLVTRRLHPSGNHAETMPMHPDDFKAHLAWITAKRLSEMVLKETSAEKPAYYRIG